MCRQPGKSKTGGLSSVSAGAWVPSTRRTDTPPCLGGRDGRRWHTRVPGQQQGSGNYFQERVATVWSGGQGWAPWPDAEGAGLLGSCAAHPESPPSSPHSGPPTQRAAELIVPLEAASRITAKFRRASKTIFKIPADTTSRAIKSLSVSLPPSLLADRDTAELTKGRKCLCPGTYRRSISHQVRGSGRPSSIHSKLEVRRGDWPSS